ncbi:hypothetical protein BE04_49585 [Sorangium cellulosum]|uniref:Uncharacterized protein n=1 Tax=Sorangium cellulosum TaxID=56 RepID=A0A150P7L7_SORCE|nr:hypothetical protein BE04_49585 [Sorangium cellulosum]
MPCKLHCRGLKLARVRKAQHFGVLQYIKPHECFRTNGAHSREFKQQAEETSVRANDIAPERSRAVDRIEDHQVTRLLPTEPVVRLC